MEPKRKAYWAAYYRMHREKKLAQRKASYYANPAYTRQQQRGYREANRVARKISEVLEIPMRYARDLASRSLTT
jgi:hypothetical protein